MKVCVRLFSHTKYRVGGAEKQMELIGENLVKSKKIDLHFFINNLSNNQKNFEKINGIKVHTLGKFRDSDGGLKQLINLFNSLDLKLFYKYLFSFDYDIYHVRGATSNTGLWALFAKLFKRKKFVFTASSIVDCIPNYFRWNKIFYNLYKFAIKHADAVIVLAEYMKKAIDINYDVNSIVVDSGHKIPNGPFRKNLPILILWISNLVELKRPELFLNIFEKLKNYNIKFILIGSGTYMKAKIREFDEKYENFEYIPGVNSKEDEIYYSKASILINTSVYEGFPNTFIQAWMHETPVISLNVDPDCVICKNNLGFHAKGNLNSLTKKLEYLIKKPEIIKEMGQNCRIYAIKNHNINKTAEKYYKIYNKILI